MKTVKVGDAVKILDENSVEHDALVTANWGQQDANGVSQFEEGKHGPCINVVFVTADKAKTDCYGAQTEHLSSIQHRDSPGVAPGRVWWN